MSVGWGLGVKIGVTLALVAAAHFLFDHGHFGSWVGAFALVWAGLLAFVRPALRRGQALLALTAAALLALALADKPSLLGWILFWSALSIATILPRAGRFDDALRWAVRLGAHAATGWLTPLADLARLSSVRRRGRRSLGSVVALLALPLLASAGFLALFASANPLIARAFAAVRLPDLDDVLFWCVMLALIWPSLRPARLTTRITNLLPDAPTGWQGLNPQSVLISLSLFNLVFAIQNGLDLAFLWSGAPLPVGVTLADYAHRGAYPLIVTALLAGLFVLMLRPGSATAADRTIRRLVVLWVAQNLLLVASSILRTCDYIAVYMLTPLRIAALVWMALVGLGLALICWRMLRNKSASWLINANTLAAATALVASSLVDYDAIAADWNVRHAREVGGKGVALDLCALSEAGTAALVPLAQLERRALEPRFRVQVIRVRQQILASAGEQQANWRDWTRRDAGRIARMHAILGPSPATPLAPTPDLPATCD